MIYTEIRCNLFEYVANNKLNTVVAHCISRDIAMGAGIAKQFTDMGIKNALIQYASINNMDSTRCVKVIGNMYNTPLYMTPVFNLITKEAYFHKPTYTTLRDALLEMKNSIVYNNMYYNNFDPSRVIKSLVMPKIGCGLDRLDWNTVSNMIKEIFSDIDIKVIICYI